MARRDRQHIFLRDQSDGEGYTSPNTGRNPPRPPSPQDPDAHARRLRGSYEGARAESDEAAGVATLVTGALDGFNVEFESFPGFEHNLERAFFKTTTAGAAPELKAVTVRTTDRGPIQVATVFVPLGAARQFLDELDAYVNTNELTIAGNRQNADLVERISAVRRATLRGFWTDNPDDFPGPGVRSWWETWLRHRDGGELDRLHQYAEASGVRVKPRALRLDDRIVALVEATPEQMVAAVDVLDDLAELRRPAEQSAFLADLPSAAQAEWAEDLAGRLTGPGPNAPVVCLIDTGVERSHPLLSPALRPEDCHAVDPAWGAGDADGHGTQMAGVALFNDLGQALASPASIALTHALESVKLFHGQHAIEPDAYGATTAEAVSRPEITAPYRRRAFSMTVSSKDPPSVDIGQPTAWSAAVDALTAGRGIVRTDDGFVYLDADADRAPRLLLVSTGSIRPNDPTADYLGACDLAPLLDPAQAWNALAVGAATDLHDDLTGDPTFDNWNALADPGELSPFSSTGVLAGRPWPNKPDIVAEGGNMATSQAATMIDTPTALQLLTTGRPSTGRILTTTHGTSPATATVGGLAADIWAAYPDLWPETVRALLVHSAEWTAPMKTRVDSATGVEDRRGLLRRYGWGVPNLQRAVRSATDVLTLVAEDTIHPFAKGKTNELRLHKLPWPTDVLSALGETEVRLRITLSYFVDPNPSRRGWRRRFAYQSHGLRFDVRRPADTVDRFRKRVNKAALEEGESRVSAAGDDGWLLGGAIRNKGSLHADIWTGTARSSPCATRLPSIPLVDGGRTNPAATSPRSAPDTRSSCPFTRPRTPPTCGRQLPSSSASRLRSLRDGLVCPPDHDLARTG